MIYLAASFAIIIIVGVTSAALHDAIMDRRDR
jgi:hypothetical protein